MTDGLPNPTIAAGLPPLYQMLAASGARFVMAALAAWMVKAGWVNANSETQFVTIGIGICLGLASLAWSTYAKVSVHQTVKTVVAQAAKP